MVLRARSVTRTSPKKLVSSWSCISCSVTDSVSPESEYPALFTTTSRVQCEPKWDAAAVKAASTDAGEFTSRASFRMLSESGR